MPVLALLQQVVDSLATTSDIPTATPSAFESIMLSHDKLFVVLAVVLIIWLGIAYLLFRTDRRLSLLERRLAERIAEEDDKRTA